jgi:hypothetical protein
MNAYPSGTFLPPPGEAEKKHTLELYITTCYLYFKYMLIIHFLPPKKKEAV